ncbi:hypothetical protein [Shewanella sp. Koi 1]
MTISTRAEQRAHSTRTRQRLALFSASVFMLGADESPNDFYQNH